MIVEKSRVLAIGAHADDIEYGCGGVLAAAKVAMGITVCSVNEEHREAEAFSAGEILGSETVFLNQKKSCINEREIIGMLEEKVRQFSPDIIAVHWPEDTHQDHRIVTTAVLSACRAFHGAIVFYKSPSSINFLPTIFFQMSQDIWQVKVEAIQCHQSQQERPYLSLEWLNASFSHWSESYRGPLGFCEPMGLYRLVLNEKFS